MSTAKFRRHTHSQTNRPYPQTPTRMRTRASNSKAAVPPSLPEITVQPPRQLLVVLKLSTTMLIGLDNNYAADKGDSGKTTGFLSVPNEPHKSLAARRPSEQMGRSQAQKGHNFMVRQLEKGRVSLEAFEAFDKQQLVERKQPEDADKETAEAKEREERERLVKESEARTKGFKDSEVWGEIFTAAHKALSAFIAHHAGTINSMLGVQELAEFRDSEAFLEQGGHFSSRAQVVMTSATEGPGQGIREFAEYLQGWIDEGGRVRKPVLVLRALREVVEGLGVEVPRWYYG